jgi:hypothetical protein
VIGMYAAGGSSSNVPVKPAGATPTMTAGTRSISSCWPITSRPPKSDCQNAWLSTATFSPNGATSSAPVKKRPSTGRASKKVKYLPLTIATGRSRVASPVPIASRLRANAAIC